jgi:phenylacetic acid degradation operon negative regulatory protein
MREINTIATMSETTRTLLFGIFVTAGAKLSASQVVALARPLGISATNAKSHLTRMVAQGALDRSGRRRKALYWPSEGQAGVVDGIVARLEAGPRERWDGCWLMLARPMPSNRTERERMRAALWFDGFRPWTQGVFVRPAWPFRWSISRSRAHLGEGAGLCLFGALLDPVAPDAVVRLYHLDELDRRARRLASWIRARPVPDAADGRAYATRLRVGGRVARLVAQDPRLPPELWGDRRGLGELVRAFHDFERRVAGRAEEFQTGILGPRAGGSGVKSPSRRASVVRSASEGRRRRG